MQGNSIDGSMFSLTGKTREMDLRAARPLTPLHWFAPPRFFPGLSQGKFQNEWCAFDFL